MVQKVAASITVYHPDRKRLWENIQAVLPQAAYLILIVNGKESFEEAGELVKERSSAQSGFSPWTRTPLSPRASSKS